jgi:hypothetical protein
MDANSLKNQDEEARRRALYLQDEIKDADKIYYKFKQEQKAATAANAPQQPQGDTKPEDLDLLKGIVFKRDKQRQIANAAIEQANEQQRIANAAIEQARIAEDARIEAVKAREVEKMKAEEAKRNETWWGARTGFSEFSLGNSGGGRRGKKKSKRMKNAKNKSKLKSKSQSRRQRQKRRRHSRRV